MKKNKQENKPTFEYLKALVIDDSDFQRKKIVHYLESLNINVIGEVSTPEEGLQALGSLHPNLILVDLIMPERSGLDVAEVIHEEYKDINIVLLSPAKHTLITLEALKSGCRDIIEKPYSLTAIQSILKKIAEELKAEEI